jgi:citrate synthase
MGFGHRVYTHSDPRSDIIKQWAKRYPSKPATGGSIPFPSGSRN